MIIGIETAHGETQLVGKTFTFNELKTAVREISENYDKESFATQFCSKFKYKELPYSDGYADFKINLYTCTVFVTSYTCPKELDGAKVLYFTDRGTFDPVYYVGGAIAHNVIYLAVCKYDNDDAFYIFHIDENLEVVADNCFDSETCKKYMNEYDVEWHKQKQ